MRGRAPARKGAGRRAGGGAAARRGEGGARPTAGPIGAAPWGGGGDQAFFPSARDQSRLYKLELLPPSDERERPRRYPAAPAPGAGAALTLPAPGCPRLPSRPPGSPGPGGAGPCPQPTPFPWGNVAGESTTPTHMSLGDAENQLGKEEEEAPGLDGARDGWRSA